MVTPFFQAQAGADAGQFWDGSGGPDLLLVNLDQADNITVGPAGVQPGGPNGYLIPPQDAISLPADRPWWAVTDSLTPPVQLQVLPGGGNYSTSALAIAGQIAASGLALAIAEEIAAQGLALVGAPKLLYGGADIPGTGTPGLVGVSLINFQGFQVDKSHNQVSQAISAWNTAVGRPMGANVMKRYYHEGELPSAGSDSQNVANIAAKGAKVLISLKPYRDTRSPPTYTGTIPGQGLLTFAQHFTALANAIAYLVSVAGNGIEFTLWQETNLHPATDWGSSDNITAGQNYAAYVNFYGPAFKTPSQAASQILVYNAAMSLNNQIQFWASGAYASLINKIVCDAYAADWTKASGGQNFITSLNNIIGLADSLGLPFGFWEWGVTNGPVVQMTGNGGVNFKNWNETYIIGTMAGRLNAGKANADTVWYVQGTGQNDPTTDNTGTVIAEIDKTFDTLTSAPGPGVALPPNVFTVLTPNNPSPGAGYAVADGLSYDIMVNLAANGVPAAPFAQVQLQWYNNDNPNAQPIATQNWILPCGASGSGGTVTVGRGPQLGQFLSVQIKNLDTVVSMTAIVQLNSTSRTMERHSWRWDAASSVAVPGYNLAGGGRYANEVGTVSSLSIPASGSITKLFGLFSGQAFLRISGEASGFLNYVFTPVPGSFFGTAAVVNETPTTEFEEIIILPRGPLQCVITNSDAGAPHNANIVITSLD